MDNDYFNKTVMTKNGKGTADQFIKLLIDENEFTKLMVRHLLKDIKMPLTTGHQVTRISDKSTSVLIAYETSEVKLL